MGEIHRMTRNTCKLTDSNPRFDFNSGGDHGDNRGE